MSNAEIPRIDDMPTSVLKGVGEDVRVFIHEYDAAMGPALRSSHEMVNGVVQDIFLHEGIKPNRDLELLLVLAARIAVGKLVTTDSFRIEYGGNWLENNPREIVEVNLRPEETPVRDADISSHR